MNKEEFAKCFSWPNQHSGSLRLVLTLQVKTTAGHDTTRFGLSQYSLDVKKYFKLFGYLRNESNAASVAKKQRF
jgi:hypothetical protein